MFFELKASSTALLNLGKRYLEAKLDFKHCVESHFSVWRCKSVHASCERVFCIRSCVMA